MYRSKATQIAAAQMIDRLGAPAGFLIAVRLIQVIAERSSPKSAELIDAFAVCLRGMERFASVAGLGRPEGATSSGFVFHRVHEKGSGGGTA